MRMQSKHSVIELIFRIGRGVRLIRTNAREFRLIRARIFAFGKKQRMKESLLISVIYCQEVLTLIVEESLFHCSALHIVELFTTIYKICMQPTPFPFMGARTRIFETKNYEPFQESPDWLNSSNIFVAIMF
jgi:hypothetical protein